MKKYKVRLIKEDKEAYGGDLGRHGGSGRVRLGQTIKKGDTVQFQVADYRTNTRKYYKGIVMMLKGERGYQRVVSDRAQVKVTHEAEQATIKLAPSPIMSLYQSHILQRFLLMSLSLLTKQ